jgi:hypothetical protein
VPKDIFFKQAPAGAGRTDLLRFQAVFGQDALRSGHDAGGRLLGGGWGSRRSRFGWGDALPALRCGLGWSFIQVGDDLSDPRGFAFLLDDLGEHARDRRGQVHRGFLALKHDHWLVFADRIAFGFFPRPDLLFGDRFTYGRHL